MITRGYKNWARLVAVAAAAAVVVGCGDDPVPVVVLPAGNVVQGPVQGATVFADRLNLGNVGVLDAEERAYSAITGSDGSFQITSAPPYAYQLVSSGGTDTITNQPAITMLAEGGSAGSAVTTNVLTPLTTLVALTPPASREALRNTIRALGVEPNARIDQNITPAAAALVKAVTTTVTQVVAVLNDAAGGTQSVQAIPAAAVKAVQTELLTQFATTLVGKTAADLNDSAKIATVAQTATSTAVTRLAPGGGASAGGLTLTVTGATATAIATQVSNTVTTVVNAIATAPGATLSASTSDARPEATVVANAVATIQSSTSNAATTAIVQAANVAVVAPPNNRPTISGPSSDSGSVGATFTYEPRVSDTDVGDILKLSITGDKAIPPGLTFNHATGVISGTPTAEGTGTYTINVTDDRGLSAQPPLTVTLTFTRVTGATGATF